MIDDAAFMRSSADFSTAISSGRSITSSRSILRTTKRFVISWNSDRVPLGRSRGSSRLCTARESRVGYGFHLRDDLGDYGDPGWLAAAQAARALWQLHFPAQAPVPVPHPVDTKAKLKVLLDV